MRSDLDTARGIVWWAVVPLVLLVVSAVAWAAPGDPIRVCRGATEVMNGLPEGECWSNGVRELIVTTVSDLQAGDYIMGYDGLLAGYVMWPPSMLLGDPSYPFQPYNPSGSDYPSFASLGWGGGGGPGPGPGDDGGGGSGEWTLEDLDLSIAAGLFSAAFALVAGFWALGKGAGVIVQFVRRM